MISRRSTRDGRPRFIRADLIEEEITMRSRTRLLPLMLTILGCGLPGLPAAAPRDPEVLAATFSIVAMDGEREEWGVATASRVLGVGNCVPWARAQVGAVATQSAVNVTYGPRGLDLLAEGKSAADVVKLLTDADQGRDRRQLAVIDKNGNVASFTGKACIPFAGGKEGKGYACVGNLLAGPAVIADMARAFEESKGPLAWRLLTAMEAGDKAGGDKRGKQSAGIIVVRQGAGPNGFGDRYIDLRVDDHEQPLQELARILAKRIPRRPAGQ
jgi:uncharacterized Ntn-hydrolase superfamily protein